MPNALGDVVISEVYGGGGNAGALYTNDFIELYNTTASPIDLSASAVQYRGALAGASSWVKTNLTGSIPANGYFLIQQAAGAGGTVALPTPNVIGTIAMGAGGGVVALTSDQVVLNCTVAPTA